MGSNLADRLRIQRVEFDGISTAGIYRISRKDRPAVFVRATDSVDAYDKYQRGEYAKDAQGARLAKVSERLERGTQILG